MKSLILSWSLKTVSSDLLFYTEKHSAPEDSAICGVFPPILVFVPPRPCLAWMLLEDVQNWRECSFLILRGREQVKNWG